MKDNVRSQLLDSIRFFKDDSQLVLDVDLFANTIYYSSLSDDFNVFIKENDRRSISFFRVLIQSSKDVTLRILSDWHLHGVLLLQKGNIGGKINGEKISWQTFHFGLFALSRLEFEMVIKSNTDYVFLFINYNQSCFQKFEDGCHPFFKEFMNSVSVGSNYCVYPWFIPAAMQMLLLANDVYRPSNRIRENSYHEIKGLEILEIALRPLYAGGINKLERESTNSSRRIINDFVDWVLEGDGFSSTIKIFTRRNRISPSQFLTEFRRTFNITPMEFITTVRMKRVEELIALHLYDTDSIAQRVGYSSRRTLKDAYIRFYGIPLNLSI